MRSPLSYLTFTKLKNQIKSIFRTPSQLIYLIFMVALFGFVIFSGNYAELESGGEFRSITELVSITMAFFTIMFVLIFSTAFSGGSSMFTMSDVNVVFPSPLRPQKVLFYGLIRQLGLSIMLGFFILFQYSWMHSLYGVSYGALILIIVGYGLTIFLAQYLAMTLFLYTSHNEKAKTFVKVVVYLLTALLVVAVLAKIFTTIDINKPDGALAFTTAADFLVSPIAFIFPVSGWISGVLYGITVGNYLYCAIFGAAIIAFAALLTVFVVKCKNNFYEDIIGAAEVAQSAITAKKEGKVGEVVKKNVKVGKIGLNKGAGANAIYYKHVVENRRSGVLMISNMSLIFAAVVIFCAFVMRDLGIEAVFFTATYMQLFSVMLGRFSRELTKPYIYLIPESPVKKLFYAIKESLVSNIVEAIVLFIIVGIIMKASPIDVVIVILARISYSLLFLAGNIAVQRAFGGVSARYLVIVFYILIILLMIAPGALLGALATILLPAIISSSFPLFLGIMVGNVLVSILVLFLCRNLLQYADLNSK